MKTLKTIQEGFYKNTISGRDSVIKGLGLEEGTYELTESGSIKIIKHVFKIQDYLGKRLPITFISDIDVAIHIYNCPNLEGIEEIKLTNIINLIIKNCPCIKSLSGPTTTNDSMMLCIENNNNLKDLSSLKHSVITNIYCENCTQLESLNGVTIIENNIDIINCPKFKELGSTIKKIGFAGTGFNNKTDYGMVNGYPRTNVVYLKNVSNDFDYDITKYTKWGSKVVFSCNCDVHPKDITCPSKNFRWNIKK